MGDLYRIATYGDRKRGPRAEQRPASLWFKVL